MDLQNRRVTRSSLNNENGELVRRTANKNAPLQSKRVLGEQRNTVTHAEDGKKVVVSRPAVPRSSPVKRPEITGIEREFSAADFMDDVHNYLLSRESDFQPPSDFLAESGVTPKMRSILVDWLVQVHGRFHLFPETLHLTVYLIDCVINQAKVEKSELQLVGVACMLVAAKFEEMYVPDIVDFEYIADNAFTRRQILRMEMNVLRACNFALSRPHSITLLRWLSKELNVGARQHAIAKYLGELALMDQSLMPYLPSQIAAISIVIAGKLTGNEVEVAKMAKMIGWTREELKSGARVLAQATLRLHNQEKLQAMRLKYASSKLSGVSNFTKDDLVILNDI